VATGADAVRSPPFSCGNANEDWQSCWTEDLRAVADAARLLPSQSDDAMVSCTLPRARVPPGQLGGERGELVERSTWTC
jgi:hypothetical protein